MKNKGENLQHFFWTREDHCLYTRPLSPLSDEVASHTASKGRGKARRESGPGDIRP